MHSTQFPQLSTMVFWSVDTSKTTEVSHLSSGFPPKLTRYFVCIHLGSMKFQWNLRKLQLCFYKKQPNMRLSHQHQLELSQRELSIEPLTIKIEPKLKKVRSVSLQTDSTFQLHITCPLLDLLRSPFLIRRTGVHPQSRF